MVSHAHLWWPDHLQLFIVENKEVHDPRRFFTICDKRQALPWSSNDCHGYPKTRWWSWHRLSYLIATKHKLRGRSFALSSTYLVGHEGRNRSSDLVIPLLVSHRTEEDEDEPRRHRHLGDALEEDGLLKPDERDYGSLEEVDLADEDVGSLGAGRDLFQEVLVELRTGNKIISFSIR